MGKGALFRKDLGKFVFVSIGDGTDLIAGRLDMVTDDFVFVEELDSYGNDEGIRHSIPWEVVAKVTSFDDVAVRSYMSTTVTPPSPPDWVADVIQDYFPDTELPPK